MNKKIIMGTLVVLLATTVHAKPGSGGHGPNPEKHFRQLIEGLELSPQQRSELKDILSPARTTGKEKFKKVHEKRKELFAALADKSVSDEVVKAKARELDGIMQDFGNARIERMLTIRRVLTQDQLTRFSEQLKEDMKRRRFDGERLPNGKEN